MKCLVGLGSNLGEKKHNLVQAVKLLSKGLSVLRISPLVQTCALVPDSAPADWNKSFLNGVIEVNWEGTPGDLLRFLKHTEKRLGRIESPCWAPRIIDLDLLTCGDQVFHEPELSIPHVGIWDRQFVLGPLKHLYPLLKLPGKEQTVLARTRDIPHSTPLWMGILNLTPDSFSDGGEISDLAKLEEKINTFEEEFVQILDIGAESTRPGAVLISHEEEWRRLRPTLEWLRERFRSTFFHPLISIDTYHVETAQKSVELGADIINDVSGLRDPRMLDLLKESTCQYVLMHSLGVPADPNHILIADDPVIEIKRWAIEHLRRLDSVGISLDRVLFDPGIGFGKSASQSWSLIKRIDEFFELPVRIVVGHSRKSFLSSLGHRQPQDRDWNSLGVSLRLAERGVDVLRVHSPQVHMRTHLRFLEASR